MREASIGIMQNLRRLDAVVHVRQQIRRFSMVGWDGVRTWEWGWES